MSRVRFGTDGIRGTAGRNPCTPEVAMSLGRAMVRWMRSRGSQPTIAVARDPRESGPVLEAALCAGIAGEGGSAVSLGVLPTSGLACALAAGLGDAGVMLTASHNPAEDNGFKVLGPGGLKLNDEDNAWLEREMAVPSEGGALGKLGHADGLPAYLSRLELAVGDLDSLQGKRIAVDLANGAAVVLRPWLAQWPVNWVLIGTEGRINDGVGSEHPEKLTDIVREQGCDAGFAVDGDGDRCRLVTAAGPVDGDALAFLLARATGATALAVTVMSNAGLEAALPGVKVIRTPVGDRHLALALQQGEATLGCEESGHVLFSDALPTGDGVVTALRALQYAFSEHETLTGAIAGYVPFPKRLTKVRITARPPLETVRVLVDAIAEGDQALGTGGRVFVRYSGTEPLLRILVEGMDAGVVETVSADVTRVAMTALG